MIKLNKNSIVYVLCPAYTKTGGPELLHQLVYKLNKFGVNSYITYFDFDLLKSDDLTPKDFKKYIKEYKLINDMNDNKNNVVIFPETSLELVKKFVNIRKGMWWLSVDNYVNKYEINDAIKIFGLKQAIVNILKFRIKYQKDVYNFDYHLCQSQYAIDYLNKKHIKNEVYYLSDYINSVFFKKAKNKKFNNVLYNPKKGYKFTKKLINNSLDMNWIPIKGLTTDGVQKLLRESKVYVDFGNHPGKDRFPREAVMSGCCVITGKNGSANNTIDVPIPKKYKFDRCSKNIDLIIDAIKYCINEYNESNLEFDKYRKKILNEEANFENDIKKIFVVRE